MDQIYLDNNATSRMDPRVADAINACLHANYVNPASSHHLGRQARRVLEDARDGIAGILGCQVANMHADRILFTSGGTEANNLALLGLAGQAPGRVIISAIEHPSVSSSAEHLSRIGFDVKQIRVSRDGVVDLDHFRSLLTADTRLVSVMLGNNETGVIQPVAEIAQICRPNSIPVHTDAVQVVGKLSVSFQELGVAALTLTAHKLHGPVGIGALVVRPQVKLEPQLYGGFQQAGLRPGTEPVTLAVGFLEALRLWQQETDQRATRMQQLRDRLEAAVLKQIPWAIVHGQRAPRLPHTSNIAFPGLDRQALLMALDLAGVACSTGSACASGSSEPSPVLLAMGLPSEQVESALRISLGADTTTAEIDLAVRRISQAAKDLQQRAGAGKSPSTTRQSIRNAL